MATWLFLCSPKLLTLAAGIESQENHRQGITVWLRNEGLRVLELSTNNAIKESESHMQKSEKTTCKIEGDQKLPYKIALERLEA